MKKLKRNRAIVTGAGAGIGRAIAKRLAEEGAKTVVMDLNFDAAQETAQLILDRGNVAFAVGGDVSCPEDVEKAFTTCEENWGHCNLLVNNAGIAQQIEFTKMTVEDWDRMISVHLRGCFLFCHRAVPNMCKNRDGIIVNITSQLGQIGGVELVHYSAAKAGIIGLTKALAREISNTGVRVNAVAPGPINTELVATLSAEWRETKIKELPLGRFGEPEDVAATVAFLATDDAQIYVGQTLGPNSGDVML
ncbi:MAG: 3-oxoacyl-ACP reductase FabG [Sneathiella sp.]|uniref:SDR family NAD(P)-dependent oxidoreductase n=1 Tax=Sneathiella sp. TaxID=1964365 RepID=UPI0030012F8D